MILQQENNIIPRKKIIRIHIICLAVVILFFILSYIGISIFYLNHFTYNTWINGYYCTGLTSEEALELVSSDDVVPSVTVVLEDGTEYKLDMSDVEFSYDYGNTVSELLDKQSAFGWLSGIGGGNYYTVSPIFSIAKDDLLSTFEALDFVEEEMNREPDYLLYYSEREGKYTFDNNLVHRLNYDQAFEDLYEGVLQGNNTLVIAEDTYYFDYNPNNAQNNRMKLFDRIDAYQNCDLVYDMGAEKIVFTPDVALSFLVMEDGFPAEDESHNFIIDDEKVSEWVTQLCEDYDTFEKIRLFESTRGETVEVSGGTYGTLLNPETEIEYLTSNLLNTNLHDGLTDYHTPEYLMTAYARGKNDVGSTYIEVDLTTQHLYYYENGTLTIDSDIVSGNLRTRNDTAQGTYFITAKEINRYIIGADFTSFVNYWMPYYKNYGIDDSTWREEYGGEIYKTSGSHGQINIPLDVAEKLFDAIEIGIPIVVFY